MKIIVASDIHGSNYFTKKLMNVIKNEEPNKVILLGDIYYHGPRNKLPKRYNPKKVAENLNSISEKIKCVKGNCDAEVDQMISSFKFEDSIEMKIAGKNFLFVHGHKLNFDKLPAGFDFIFGGHTHVHKIEKFDKVTYVNPGSISIPKSKTTNSYAVIDNKTISIFNFKGTLIDSCNI